VSSPRFPLAWLAWLALTLGAGSAAAQAASQTFQVPMPDGVTLATDVWLPTAGGGPRPVLLRRTPYGRAVAASDAANVIDAGYVLVSQDVRGRGGSGGSFVPFFSDKVDGKATVDWIAAQSWSNGKVGTYSASAEGIVQYMAMASAPEALLCSHVVVATPDLYEGLFPGGAWRTDLGTNWLDAQGVPGVVDLWKSHEVRDGYWDAATLSAHEMAGVDHPVFVVGGMFDIFSISEVHAFRALQANVAPSARQDVFLVLGPWTHGGITTSTQGQVLYGQDAAYAAYVTDLIAYFGWCLQGSVRPDFPAVRYYLSELSDTLVVDPSDGMQRISASGEWREATTWPPPGARDVQLFLHADDVLRGSPPDASEGSHTLDVDPTHLVPSLGGGNLTTAAGPYDQAPIDGRADVYVTAIPPVEELVEVVGSPRAALWVSSATSDLDVIVRAEVLTPAGKAIAMTDGILRGRFAGGLSRSTPLTPDEPTLFELELGPIAVRLPVGYALRFAIAGSSSPRYEANPNQAVPLADAPTPVATRLTLHRDSEHPSRLYVPLIAGHLPGEVEMTAGDAGADAGGALDAAVAAAREAGASTSGMEADADGGAAAHPHHGCSCGALGAGAPTGWGAFALMSVPLAFAARRRSRARARAA
jgi:predicted acyl esterase